MALPDEFSRGERFTAVTTGLLVALLPVLAVRGDSALDAGEQRPHAAVPARTPPDGGRKGVSGRVPHDPVLSPRFHEDLRRGGIERGTGRLGRIPAGTLGIPGVVLAAYQRAQESLAKSDPGCGLHWSVLAGIGRVESNHARSGQVDASGRTYSPILGPRLDGGPGIAAIRDTDGGGLDGDVVWDRAVGPMQFIPETWRSYAHRGADPHNVFDAAAASGRYLCAGDGNLRDRAQLAAALFRYNPSETYVRTVLAWADRYARGVVPTPGLPPGAPDPTPSLAGAPPPGAVVAMAPPGAAPAGAPPAPAPASGPAPAPAPAPAPPPPPPPAPGPEPTPTQPPPPPPSEPPPPPPPSEPPPSSSTPPPEPAPTTTSPATATTTDPPG